MKCHILISRPLVADSQTSYTSSLREVADAHPRHGIATALKFMPKTTYPLQAGPILRKGREGSTREKAKGGRLSCARSVA